MIKMRLDTAALRALIKDNPEIEIEIGKAVLNNIKDETLNHKVEAKVIECLRGLTENKGTHWAPQIVARSPELKAAVKSAVDECIKTQIETSVSQLLDARIAEMIKSSTLSLKLEMAKDLVREKLF